MRRPPQAPTGLRAVSVTSDSVSLEWNPSPDLRTGDKYQIYMDSVWSRVELTVCRHSTKALPGTHVFRVRAGCTGSYGPWSLPLSVLVAEIDEPNSLPIYFPYEF